MILTLTSDTYGDGKYVYGRPQMYDVGLDSILAQKLSQVNGVGQVNVGGVGVARHPRRGRSNRKAQRDGPEGLDDVKATLRGGQRKTSPPGYGSNNDSRDWSLATTDQLYKADQDYRLVDRCLQERRADPDLRHRLQARS